MVDPAAKESSAKVDGVRLYTFWISHFSEKARWALDFEGISFTEHKLFPGPHLYQLRKLNHRRQVPTLSFDGRVVAGSGAIVDALVPLFGKSKLQPWRNPEGSDPTLASRSAELEELADECFGRATQSIVYDILLQHPRTVIALWNYQGPWWGRVAYTMAFPALKQKLAQAYCRDAQTVQQHRDRLIDALDATDAILCRQPYLLGDEPTRVDIAVAALLAPFVRPEQHLVKWPKPYPAQLEQFCAEHDRRPTWQFVRRMYRLHR